MRPILTAACAVLLCAGCSSGGSKTVPVGAVASCASRITWHGTVYFGQVFASLPPDTLILGTGGRPTCLDSNGGEAGASSTVQVRRLVGVDPRVAVAVRGEGEVAYLARGYFVQLPSHPLHASLRRWQRSRSELKGCARMRSLPPFEGTIAYRTGAVVGISTAADARPRRYIRREAVLFVDPYTHIESLSRGGLTYVAPGTRVVVKAEACLWPDGRLRKLVPRRIAPA